MAMLRRISPRLKPTIARTTARIVFCSTLVCMIGGSVPGCLLMLHSLSDGLLSNNAGIRRGRRAFRDPALFQAPVQVGYGVEHFDFTGLRPGHIARSLPGGEVSALAVEKPWHPLPLRFIGRW